MSVVAAWERGRARWSALALELEQFRAFVGDGETGADELHAEDVYLAAACVAGVPGAAAAFTENFRGVILELVARVLPRGAPAADLADVLLIELVLGDPPAPPKLASYSGRGPLRTWLRMTATRRALNASRDGNRQAELDDRLAREAVRASPDPEAALLKARYAPEFGAALRGALAARSPAARNLLRMHYGDGLGLSAIAAMNGWSKPTAGRRLAEARDAVLTETCRVIQERLQVTRSELQSLLRLVRSDLTLSLAGLFDEAPG